MQLLGLYSWLALFLVDYRIYFITFSTISSLNLYYSYKYMFGVPADKLHCLNSRLSSESSMLAFSSLRVLIPTLPSKNLGFPLLSTSKIGTSTKRKCNHFLQIASHIQVAHIQATAVLYAVHFSALPTAILLRGSHLPRLRIIESCECDFAPVI